MEEALCSNNVDMKSQNRTIRKLQGRVHSILDRSELKINGNITKACILE